MLIGRANRVSRLANYACIDTGGVQLKRSVQTQAFTAAAGSAKVARFIGLDNGL